MARPRWPKRPERPLQRQLLIIIPWSRRLQLGDSSHSVQIGLGSAGEIKVDDDIHSLDVDTASEQIYSSAAVMNAECQLWYGQFSCPTCEAWTYPNRPNSSSCRS